MRSFSQLFIQFSWHKSRSQLQLHLQLVSIHIHAAKWKRQHLNAIYLNLSNHYTQLPPPPPPPPPPLPSQAQLHHHHRLRVLILAASPWSFAFICCLLLSLLLLLLLPFTFFFPLFARLAHLNVFSWHLHRHSIRLISFSCHSQWVDESLGCLLLDSFSSPVRVLVWGCLLLCGSYCMPGRFGSSCVFLITFN